MIGSDRNGFLISLSESIRTDFGRVEFSLQPEAQKVFSAIWALESEVNNGGFEQYFLNAGDNAAYAPLALQRIGAHRCAAIVSRALAVLGPGPLPAGQAAREELILSMSDEALEELSTLDSKFFEYPDNLTELLFEFVRANPEAFGPG